MEDILSFFVIWSASCAVFGFVAGWRCRARVRVASSAPPSKVQAEEKDEAVSDPPRAVLRNQFGRHVEALFHTTGERTMVHASANCPRLKSASKHAMRRELCSECFPDKPRR
eukprot:8333529-Pyramimonas_sp.AAC.1